MQHFKVASQTPAPSSVEDLGDKSLLTTQPTGPVQSQRGDGWRAAPKKARASNQQKPRVTPCCPCSWGWHVRVMSEHGSGMTLVPRESL